MIGFGKSGGGLFASKKLPLAILVNDETRGAAETLASELRAARAGLIFESVAGPAAGTNSETAAPAHPDIAVAIGAEDERALMENPYAVPAPDDTNSRSATNSLLPFVDYTSEADLVRAKIKDGEEDRTFRRRAKPSRQNPSSATRFWRGRWI